MKKIIWAIVAVAIAGYFINSHFEDESKRKVEELKTKKSEEVIRTAVKKMVSRSNAVYDWALHLEKGKKYFSPIFTIDLESVWLTKRPILFIGVIKDIATLDKLNYTIELKRGFHHGEYYVFGEKMEVSLRSSKKIIDSFLKKHPNLNYYDNLAVIARINNIRAVSFLGEDGLMEEVRIGEGKLLDIKYIGRVSLKKLDAEK